MINKNDLNDYFVSGIKHKKNLKIGVEHEKFILDKDTLEDIGFEVFSIGK